jgi:predicted Zn-dependent protease
MNSLTKKLLIFALVMTALGAAGWFGRKAYKSATERRLVAQSAQYLEKKDARNAVLCLQRALKVNPSSYEATKAMADLLEKSGVPVALSWRIRAAQIKPNDAQCRYSWARTALALNELPSAANALAGVDGQAKTTADYHTLAGALAWGANKAGEAETHYKEALRLEPTNQTSALNLATIHLASTNQEVANAARLTLEQIATNPALRSTALHHLAEDAEANKSFAKALAYSKEILQSPSATFTDKIGHLVLLQEAKSSEAAPWLATLKAEAGKSPATAFALGRWMASAENSTNALRWLQSLPATVQTNFPAPLLITDCQMAVNDWPGLLALLNKEEWGELDYYKQSLVARAQRTLGQKSAATSAWQKALRLSSHRLDRLSRLSQVTAAWHWTAEREEILREITTVFPKERWAVDQLVAQFYAEGNTRGIQDLLLNILTSNPTDIHLKNNLANVILLRKAQLDKGQLDKAHRLAREAYEATPNDPFFASTYAYSLLIQGKTEEAGKVLGSLKPEFLQIPSIAAYYGVVEARSGRKDLAKEPLARAAAAPLLPEEKEMVRLAIAQL